MLYVEGYTQREIAEAMRLSQPRISQLHTDLLRHGQVDSSTLAA
jgi:DNA-binding transcriptional regulator LsrR (DeoR family)